MCRNTPRQIEGAFTFTNTHTLTHSWGKYCKIFIKYSSGIYAVFNTNHPKHGAETERASKRESTALSAVKTCQFSIQLSNFEQHDMQAYDCGEEGLGIGNGKSCESTRKKHAADLACDLWEID